MESSLLQRTGSLIRPSASEESTFFLKGTDATGPPAKRPPSSSDEPPGGGPEDDWKTRWALYFFIGVLALSFLYFLVMAFSM